ncbi:hypothetical protein IFR05_007198 [Cadophora sp. M221]|nr:hypothetical protein IFR05_007198 [Cadophora sp. M221]
MDSNKQQDISPYSQPGNVVFVPEGSSLADALFILLIRPGGYELMIWLATKIIVSRNIQVWMEDYGDIVKDDIGLAQMIQAFMALMMHMTHQNEEVDRFSAILNAIHRRIAIGMYKNLDRSRSEIRLLRMHPIPETQLQGNADGLPELVSCSMEIHSLDDENLKFDALSYVWGDSSQVLPVFIDGKIFLVTRNLFEALETFRDNNVLPGLIWIDAICINQQDSQERNHQVTLMAKLYSQAEKVRIWIGPETEHTAVLFDKLKACVGDQNRPGAVIMNAIHLADDESGITHGLLDLLSRKWWTRLWVVQEAGLARNPRIHCGIQEFDFRHLEHILVNLRTMSEEIDGDSPAFRALSHSILMQVQRLSLTLEISRHGGNMNPTNLLDSTSHCDSAVPHDRLYALLGILPPALGIIPAYEASVEEVFESAALRIMQWSGSLDLLRITALADFRKLDLPSWVPELGNTVDGLNMYKGPAHFKADMGASCSVSRDQPRQLTVKALVFDEVLASIQILPLYTNRPNPCTIDHIRVRLKACRDFVQNHLPNHGIDDFTFWQALSTDKILRPGLIGRRWNEDKRDAGLESEWSRFIQDDSYIIEESAKSLLMSSIWAAHSHSQLFITTGGRLGIVDAAEVESGDVVAVLAGSKEPAVLRRALEGSLRAFKLIQNCYCNGFSLGVMDGEAIVEAYEKENGRDESLARNLQEASQANRSSATRDKFRDSQAADFWVRLQEGIDPLFEPTILV